MGESNDKRRQQQGQVVSGDIDEARSDADKHAAAPQPNQSLGSDGKDDAAATTAVPGKLSPRADLWVYLVISSTAATASLGVAVAGSRTVREKVAVSLASLALVVTLFVSLEFRFQPSRDRLTRTLGCGGRGAKRARNATMELIFACFVLLLWCFVMWVVLDARVHHLGVTGLGVSHCNIFYATWISFALMCYIVADLITTDNPSGVLPYEYLPRNQTGRSWILLLIASLVLLSFNLEASTGEICSSAILQSTSVCRYTISGTVFGFVGLLLALVYLVYLALERAFPKRSQLLGTIMSLAATLAFGVNAGIGTSPGSPGAETSNLYWASWLCFALSFYVCVAHIEMYIEASTYDEEEMVSSEQVPLMQHSPTTAQRLAVPESIKASSSRSVNSAPGSTNSSTSRSTAFDGDDDSSCSKTTLKEGSDSELALLLPQKSQCSSGSAIPILDPQHPIKKPRMVNKRSLQAREEKKKMLFKTMSSSQTTTATAAQTSVIPKKQMLFSTMNAAPMTASQMSGVPNGNNRASVKADSSISTGITMDKSGFQNNLRDYLKGLKLPEGLLFTVMQNYTSCDSRLWLIDNSSSMKVRDSHLIGPSMDKIQRKGNVSRWDELRECVAFHTKMSARCWQPTKFWLSNDPGPSVGRQKFSICWKTPGDVAGEMNEVRRVMTAAEPQNEKNPLGHQIRCVQKGISKEASRLTSHGKHITFVVCTAGVPTNSKGNAGPAAANEFQEALSRLLKLPVKVVLRLCNEDNFVLNIKSNLACCDVLSNYWEEAKKIHSHNPWLTYSIGIHRLREAGLAWGLADSLNSRPLTLDEIHTFCQLMFLGASRNDAESDFSLSHSRNWTSFMRSLTRLVNQEEPIWNPIKNTMTPWINISTLQSIYGAQAFKRLSNQKSNC